MSKKTPFFLCFSWAPGPTAFDFTLGWCEEMPHVLRQLTAYLIETNGSATERVFKGCHG